MIAALSLESGIRVRPVRARPPRLYAVHVVLPALEQEFDVPAPSPLNAIVAVMQLCGDLELCTAEDWRSGAARVVRLEERV